MKKTKKYNWKKIRNRAIVSLGVIFMILNFFPNLLFAEKVTYKNIHLYSDQSISKEYKPILEKVYSRLKQCELFDNSIQLEIYICNNAYLYKLLNFKARNYFGATNSLTRNIFLSKSDIENDRIYLHFDNSIWAEFNRLITHEIIHVLIINKYGYFNNLLIKQWQDEGYAEFISYDRTIDYHESIEELINLKKSMNTKNKMRYDYQSYRLVVTYLINEKNFNFDKLISSEVSFEDVIEEIKSKYK